MPLLSVRNLSVRFRRGDRFFNAVDDVSFDVAPGEALGLVGESGSGKTTIGRALLQLLPQGNAADGTVLHDGVALNGLSPAAMRARRARLQMIFQDPVSSFNPRRAVEEIVAEGLVIAGLSRAERIRRVEAALTDVGLGLATVRGRRPHQFSGGQCQRIAIARALAVTPDLVVCDEPVASLDVSVQAQVINLLADLRRRRSLALVFISHDLAVVRNVSERVAVLYLGRIVEIGSGDTLFRRPAHPYTQMLLDAVPVPDASRKLVPAPEASSALGRPPSHLGCRFRERCPRARPRCADEEPRLDRVAAGQQVACHYPNDTVRA